VKKGELPSKATEVCWALARQTLPSDVVIVGVGTPLAAIAALLARDVLHPNLTVLFGTAIDPKSFDLAASLFDSSVVANCAVGNYSQIEVLDYLARGGVTLQFVSPLEIDRQGNLNVSRVLNDDGTWRRFAGSLAIPDTAALVGRLVAYRVDHDRRFFPDRVAFVSGAAPDDRRLGPRHIGHGALTAITARATVRLGSTPAVLEYQGEREGIEEEFGFSVDIGSACHRAAIPSEVLKALNRIDPLNVRGMEQRSTRDTTIARLLARTP